MNKYQYARQMLYRDRMYNQAQMTRLVNSTRAHLSQYVEFDDKDYSMVAEVDDGINIYIQVKVKAFLPTV